MALITEPVGVASLTGGRYPDIFLSTSNGADPGLFLFRYEEKTGRGVPVFERDGKIELPFQELFGEGDVEIKVVEHPGGEIHLYARSETSLTDYIYDPQQKRMGKTGETVNLRALTGPVERFLPVPGPDGEIDVYLSVKDGRSLKPTDASWRESDYRPFDGAGIWRGSIPYSALYRLRAPSFNQLAEAEATRISPSTRDTAFSIKGLTTLDLGLGREYVVSGSHLGQIFLYPRSDGRHQKVPIIDTEKNIMRHPTVGACPLSYPGSGPSSDLIVGGEGCLYYYRFLDRFSNAGEPLFSHPLPVLELDASIYAGSLPVPNMVDWDGDHNLDIVCGNSEGRILFFRNRGTNSDPSFDNGIPLKAGGSEIHVQAGYRGSIQGPDEARWGYTCPTVVDWNGDGLPDIVMSDITADHSVFLNRGTLTRPSLAAPHSIYCDGLDLHGTWRVKPAVGRMGGTMVYITLDTDDQFHLYRKIDDYNLEDGGKLRLENGSPIDANFWGAGGRGRLKLNLVDWDGDGEMDLLVGTHRHGSVPNAEEGLPQSLGLPGSAVLFLKNVGDDEDPLFRFPQVLKFKENPLFLGHHACGPTVAEFREGIPDLVVGEEGGTLIYYKREDLSP